MQQELTMESKESLINASSRQGIRQEKGVMKN